MRQNKGKRAAAVAAALLLAFGAGVIFSDRIQSAIAVNSTALDSEQQKRYSEILNKLGQIDKTIDKYYMADGEIDTELMSEGVYKGYVYGLNERYTTYYTPEEYKQMLAQSEGVYSGIGVTVTKEEKNAGLVIVEVSEGGPGEASGLMAGDVITSADGENIGGDSLDTAVSKIMGEAGTEVVLTIYRPSEDKSFDKTLTRQKIDEVTVEYELLEDHIGYIYLKGFEEVTVKQFNEAVDQLLEDGMDGLVVDVRGNPGGNMSSVCPILDRLLPEGLLVYTEDKNGQRSEEYADSEEVLDIPMAVLVNGSSASASEIFAAAIQDYEWGKIVGEQTFGKGIVQYIIPFSDGSAMKLTSAKYFTPKGRSIHSVGITPDIEVSAAEADSSTPGSGGESSEADSVLDVQLEAAVEAVKAQLAAES